MDVKMYNHNSVTFFESQSPNTLIGSDTACVNHVHVRVDSNFATARINHSMCSAHRKVQKESKLVFSFIESAANDNKRHSAAPCAQCIYSEKNIYTESTIAKLPHRGICKSGQEPAPNNTPACFCLKSLLISFHLLKLEGHG